MRFFPKSWYFGEKVRTELVMFLSLETVWGTCPTLVPPSHQESLAGGSEPQLSQVKGYFLPGNYKLLLKHKGCNISNYRHKSLGIWLCWSLAWLRQLRYDNNNEVDDDGDSGVSLIKVLFWSAQNVSTNWDCTELKFKNASISRDFFNKMFIAQILIADMYPQKVKVQIVQLWFVNV